MGIHKFKPPMSGRMGTLWTLASISNAALIEYGCMGHMNYARVFLNQAGVVNRCKLFSTHIDEADISLGDTERLNRAIESIIEKEKPKVIFLLPSSVPMVIGTDLSAICKELQPKYPNTPLIPFGYGGFDICGHKGVEEALLLLTKTLPKEVEKTKEPTFNIIASCADMFRFNEDANEIIRMLEGAFGMKKLCVMTSNTTVEDIEALGGAHVNIVIRQEGEAAALHLKERFKTPYLLSRPYGIKGTIQWIKDLEEVTGLTPNKEFLELEEKKALAQTAPSNPVFNHLLSGHSDQGCISLGGHYDVVKGIASFGEKELSLKKGTYWCDCKPMASEDIHYFSEKEWCENIMSQKGIIMASGEALKWINGNRDLQISNPDTKWRLNPYESPLVGFRGAVNLINLWVNDILDKSNKQ